MSSVNPSSQESTVSREDWDHLTPNLLDDNDETLVAEHNPFQQWRNQTQPGPTHAPSLQHNNPSRSSGADSHRVQRDNVALGTTSQLANIMRDSLNLRETSPATSRSQGASPDHEPTPPPHRPSEPLPRSVNSRTTMTKGTRIVIAIDYGTTYTGEQPCQSPLLMPISHLRFRTGQNAVGSRRVERNRSPPELGLRRW